MQLKPFDAEFVAHIQPLWRVFQQVLKPYNNIACWFQPNQPLWSSGYTNTPELLPASFEAKAEQLLLSSLHDQQGQVFLHYHSATGAWIFCQDPNGAWDVFWDAFDATFHQTKDLVALKSLLQREDLPHAVSLQDRQSLHRKIEHQRFFQDRPELHAWWRDNDPWDILYPYQNTVLLFSSAESDALTFEYARALVL